MEHNKFPDKRFLSMVKVGPKGQIVIPIEVREMFGIKPGDSLLLLADFERGIGLPHPDVAMKVVTEISARLAFDGGENS